LTHSSKVCSFLLTTVGSLLLHVSHQSIVTLCHTTPSARELVLDPHTLVDPTASLPGPVSVFHANKKGATNPNLQADPFGRPGTACAATAAAWPTGSPTTTPTQRPPTRRFYNKARGSTSDKCAFAVVFSAVESFIVSSLRLCRVCIVSGAVIDRGSPAAHEWAAGGLSTRYVFERGVDVCVSLTIAVFRGTNGCCSAGWCAASMSVAVCFCCQC
jgi:hypothetical protein